MTTSPRQWFHFLAGFVLTALAFTVVGGLVVYQRGADAVRDALGLLPPPALVHVPAAVLADLRQAGVIGDNFPGLEPEREHDHAFVQPDAELTFILRPNARLEVVVLPSGGGINLDPPLLYIPAGTTLTAAAQRFIDDHARLRYAYSTGADGHRLTLPKVDAAEKVLIVGDSVAFGVGIGDADTGASQLQAMLGGEVQVVNAGIGEYDGLQAARLAERLSRTQRYAALIYIACPNDFGSAGAEHDAPPNDDWSGNASEVLDQFNSLAGRFDRGVIVVLTSYLEYEVRDVFEPKGAYPDFYARTDMLRRDVRAKSRAAGFGYADWSEMVGEYRQASASMFAPFGLYADRVHLSRAGNRLMAEKLVSLLGRPLRAAAP